MPATVSSAFRTKDEVTPVLRKLRFEAAKTDVAFEGLGKRIDKVGSPQNVQKIGKVNREVEKTGKTTEKTAAKVGVGTRSITRSIGSMERESNPRLRRLHEALRKVELDPIKFAAEARIIKAEIRSLEQQTARSRLKQDFESWGLAAEDLGTALGGRGGGVGGGGVTARMGAFSGSVGIMAVAVAAALPIVVSLTGAVGALVGSLGAAVGGAGVLGGGTLGAMIVGFGGFISVIKPAITEVKNAKKAQDAYNRAVQQYGDKSKQAIAAQKVLDNSFKNHPGLRAFMGNLQIVQNRWRTITRPGQRELFGLGNDVLGTIRRKEPLLGRSANQSTTAIRSAAQPLLQLMNSPRFDHFITTMTDTFTRSVIPFGSGIEHIANAFMHLSEAASPYVIRMFESFDTMTAHWDRRANDAASLDKSVGGLVGQTREWVSLLKATGNLTFAFFGSGARQGQSLVRDITTQFNTWADWMRKHPAQMHAFFDRTIHSAKDLARALFEIAKEIGHIGDSLLPVLNLITSTTGLLGGQGMLGPLGALGAYKYLTRGGKGGAGGGGLFAGAGGALAGARGGYAASRAAGVGRLGALGGIGAMGLRGAGKFAAPIAGLMAAYDFASFQGTAGERLQNVGHGLTFGLIHSPVTRAAMRQQGMNEAQIYAQTHGASDVNSRVMALQAQLGRRLPTGPAPLNPALRSVAQAAPGGEFSVTGKDRAKLQAQLNYLRDVQKMQREEKRILDQEAENRRRARSIERGQEKKGELTQLFHTQRQQGVTASDAFADVSSRMLQRLGRLKPAGAKVLAQGYIAWAQQLKRSNPAITNQVDALVKDVNHRLRQLPGDAAVVGNRVYTSLRDAYKSTSQMMGNETERWREANSKALTDIQRQMVGILKAMGYDNASGIVHSMERYGKGSVSATGARGRSGRRSDVAGPVGGIGKGKYSGDGTGVPWGGPTDRVGSNIGGGGLMGANAGLGGYARDGARFGLHVSSGLRPGAITASGNQSLHATGNAIDLSNGTATPQELAYAKFMARHYGSGLDELIHTPLGFGIKNGRRVPLSFWGPKINAMHYNHVHVGDRTPGGGARGIAGGGGLMAGSVGRIRKPGVGGKGFYHDVVTRAIDIAAFAGQQKLDQLGGNAGIPAGLTGGTSGANQKLGRAMMLAMGWGANQWPSLKALGNRESGWNANAVNKSSGAYGIGQSLGHGHPYELGDARAQIAWMLRYIRGRYGSPAGAWAHEQQVGWYGNGGHFRANKPTVIGVGDRQTEDVSITPVGRTGGGGRGGTRIVIERIIVHNHREGDIAKQIERELGKVADKLFGGMTEDHTALMN